MKSTNNTEQIENSAQFSLNTEQRLSSDTVEKAQANIDVSDIVAKYDKEAAYRTYTGLLEAFIKIVCILFSLFHLFTAAAGQFPPQIQRSVHLGFVLVLIFLLYPARSNAPKNKLPWYDLLLSMMGAAVCGYIVWNYETIVLDAGPATTADFVFGLLSIILVLEATRRIVGFPIMFIALCFLLYALFGNLIPGMMGHTGFSIKRIVSYMYLTTEGLFGMPLGVSASFVFLFILFGAFLHSTGLGKFFIDLSLACAGRFVGGPAKVAVLASGFFGTISGSSVANTVSTGTFTIPLMKSVGYRGAFAGAVEAASSTGGQIMPPIMGAASFIMAQFLGVSYIEIAKAALIPAILYYLAVGLMVHMEAKRLGLQGIAKERLPRAWPVFKQGGYLLIPVVVLIYLLIQGYTPLKSAYYCILTTVILSLLSQNIKTFLGARATDLPVLKELCVCNKNSLNDFLVALEKGGRLALGVAAACACTGFVVGTVTLTGVGLKLANTILTLSGNSFILTLFFTMLSSIILGMGLPTTAKYIVLATIAAPAIQAFGTPQIAAHLFIMYFGILADLTPPVALAAYAAAGIAKSEPNATGFMAVKLAGAGFLIPYIFCYDPSLLMIGASPIQIAFIVGSAILGITSLAFAAVGFWKRKLYLHERLILLAATIALIDPGPLSDLIGIGCMTVAYLLQKFTGGQTTAEAG